MGPFLMDYFTLNKTQMGMIASAVFGGVMLGAVPSGWLVEVIGVRRMFLYGPSLMALALIGIAASGSYVAVIGCLVILGLGNSVMMPTANKAIFQLFPKEERGLAMGIKQSSYAAGPALGAAILPGIAWAYGWRSGYGITALFLGAVAMITFLNNRNLESLTVSSGTKRNYAGFRALKEILLKSEVWMVGLFGLSIGAAQITFTSFLMPFLNETLAISVGISGALLAAAQFAGAAGRPLLGIISDRQLHGRRKNAICLTSFSAAGCMLLIANLNQGVSMVLLTGLMLVMGFSVMSWAGLYFTLMVEVAGEEHVGLASSMSIIFNLVGIILGPPIFGMIVDFTSSYQVGFRIYAVWLAVAAAVFFASKVERSKITDGKYRGICQTS